MDTKKLRQKILDLAIHGKLVPQDPNDEPASVLLERIRAEKEQLIKEGKIKAPKKSKSASDTSHYPKEVPFEVPKGWVWASGNDIFFPMESTSPKGDYFDYIDIDAVDNTKNIIKAPKHIPVKNAPSRASRKVSKGDILFSMVRPYLRNIAMVEYEDCIASTGFYVCRCSEILDNNYCFYLMLSDYVVDGLNQYMKGDNSPSINNSHITSWLYPIPPLSEQRRISKVIEKLLRFSDSLAEAEACIITTIDWVKTKLLDLAIHGKLVPQDPSDEPAIELLKRINPDFKPSDNLHYGDNLPDGWMSCRVDDAFSINPKIQGKDEDDCAFIPMMLIEDGYSNSFKYDVRKWYEIKSGYSRFADGDIVVAKISPCLENRKSAIMHNLPGGYGAGTTELIIFRPKYVIAEYGLVFFKSDWFISHCKGTFSGVVGQQRVDISSVKQISINIPPLEEQKRIVNMVKKVYSFLDTLNDSVK